MPKGEMTSLPEVEARGASPLHVDRTPPAEVTAIHPDSSTVDLISWWFKDFSSYNYI